MTTQIVNSDVSNIGKEKSESVVDISGALNATEALSASAALKMNEEGSKSNSEQNKTTNVTTPSSGFEQFVDLVTSDSIAGKVSNGAANSLSNTTSMNTKEEINVNANNSTGTLPQSGSNLGMNPLKPEDFIDNIEKFVNFVSKERLAKAKSESPTVTSTATSDKSDEQLKKDSESIDKNGSTEKSKEGSTVVNLKKEETSKEDDVDADLKSYASAVNDMLENEVEIPPDGNDTELDAEIKTLIVSNNDTGEVKMTVTDSAVGRFETIGKNEDAAGSLSDGLSPLRKSRRTKKRKVYEDFDQADTPFTLELDNIVDEVSRAIEGEPEEEDSKDKTSPVSNRQKSKRKNPTPKKAKLTVEEVYESDSNEESDGDLTKDILKVRMAKCDICDKHFLDRKKLDEHKKRHKKKSSSASSSQADYPCVVCGKIFLKREHWRRHVKIHDDVRPYACPVCKKGFRRKEHVKRHMLIHTGEKPFECMFCSQRYQRADHLKKHLQQHTKGDYVAKKRKGEKSRKTTTKGKDTKRRKPTAKAAKLVAKSRVAVKKEVDFDGTEEEEEDHYSDGLSDDDDLATNDDLE